MGRQNFFAFSRSKVNFFDQKVKNFVHDRSSKHSLCHIVSQNMGCFQKNTKKFCLLVDFFYCKLCFLSSKIMTLGEFSKNYFMSKEFINEIKQKFQNSEIPKIPFIFDSSIIPRF